MPPNDTIKIEKLQAGDTVGIISPSSPFYSKKDLSLGIKTLESLGLKTKIGTKAFEVHGNYKAGKREERLHDLHSMFLDDEVKAIFCTTGGYAAIELLPDIDWRIIQKNPKIFIGYSDITTLLVAIHERTSLPTFHGPIVEELESARTKGKKFTLKNMEDVLFKGRTGKLPNFTEWKVLRPGRAEGNLIGGNLSVVLNLLGTPFEPKWEGKILFWEQAGDTVEGINNCLWRLRVSKVFKKIEGMIIGKITNLESIEEEKQTSWTDVEKPTGVEEIILEATEGYNFPVLYGVDIGHDVPSLTLPLGAKATLECPTPGRVGNIFISEPYLT